MSDDLARPTGGRGIDCAAKIDVLMYRVLGPHLVWYLPPHLPGRHLTGSNHDLEVYERARKTRTAPSEARSRPPCLTQGG